jgi:hypothetical protein
MYTNNLTNQVKTNLDMETEKISMFFSAVNLPSKKGTTDAFASIFAKNRNTGELMLLTHTEVKLDTNHPAWHTHSVADYQFQEIQEIVVKVYHKHKHCEVGINNQHELLGETTFTESSLMMSHGSKLEIDLPVKLGVVGNGRTKLIVRGESVASTRDIFVCNMQLNNLTRKNGLGIFGKSDPYIKISRKFEDGSFTTVWTSQHIMSNLNPLYKNIKISMLPLCNGDVDKELAVDVYDYDPQGNHLPMGGFKTTCRELLESNGKPFTLIETAKIGRFMYSNSGTFKCLSSKIEHHPTLGQFIMGGLDINLCVAIDFTASNGEPETRRSLHRKSEPGQPLNDYEKAINAVASVIEPYSNSKQFSVYGFGAKIKQPDGTLTPTQHCFPIYGGESIVNGTNGIIQAYHDALSVLSLSGPTYFCPLIDCGGYLSTQKGCTQSSQNYTIMLILTDGIIDDSNETIQALIRASNTPLSIIIVGIGNEDFSDMDKLDSDEKMLSYGGATASRDIVQFVPFKKFMQKGPIALAQSVLKEIPSQIIKFMENNKINPNPIASAPTVDDNDDGEKISGDESPPPSYEE